MSPEHVIPLCLGRFGDFQVLHGRVCAACNNAIGTGIEEQFCRTGPNGFFRWLLAIEGREGRPPSPFYRGSGGAPPIFVHGHGPGFDHDLLWEVEWGTMNVFPLRQIVFRDEVRGRVPIALLDRTLRDPTQLTVQLEEAGIPNAVPERVFAAEDEIPAVEALLRTRGALPPGEWLTTEFKPDVQLRAATLVQVTGSYFRAAAKVVFHYALQALDGLTGSEEEFAPIRAYVMHGEGAGFVQESRRQIVANFEFGQRPTRWSHIVAAWRDRFAIRGFVQFFAGPESLPFPLEVTLGRNPSALGVRTERVSHAFVIDEVGPGRPLQGHVEDMRPLNYVVPWLGPR